VDGNIQGSGLSARPNTLDESAYSTPVTINLAARTTTGVGGTIAALQNFVGSAAGGSTLAGPNAPTAWTVSGSDAGTVAGGSFSNFSNLIGGSGGNTFVLSAGAALDGTLDGGPGGAGLVGPDANTVWNVTGSNAGTVSGPASVTFIDVGSLTGGAGADDFVFADGASLSGNLNGGGGFNTLDYSAYSTPVRVNLAGFNATGVGSAIQNLQSFVGSANGGNDLTGQVYFGKPFTWALTGRNTGSLSVNGVSWAFAGFQNLDALGQSTFVFSDGAGVDGNINAGGTGNVLDESAYSTPVTVDLAARTATGIGGTFAGLQSLVGSAAGGNSLNGPAAVTTWNVTGTDAGTVSGGYSFAGFGNLTGGAGNNLFYVLPGASLDGTLTGGGGTNTLNYQSYDGNVLVDLQTGTATGVGGGVANIQNVTGNSAGAAGSFYNILVGNGGNVLTGGSDQRNLLIAGGSASTLMGGSDNDILIAGTTDYDTNLAALLDIMSVWSSADTFANRVARLVDDPTYAFSLNAATVHSNGGGNTLRGKFPIGANAADLYFANLGAGDVIDAAGGDRVVGIV
jgi:hypothetical protein